MPFALTNDPSQSEISEAINYLLANFGPNLSADPNSGQISGPSGVVIAYLYQYIAVKYADSFDGTLNFSNSPTGRTYYGLRNTNDPTESTNPADYIWFLAAGGFGTTRFLFYQTNGGRQINFFVGTTAPNSTYLQETGSSIDLDVVTTTTAYNTAAPSIYQWTSTSTPPTRPTTTSTYTWATGAYTAPSGWTTTPTTNTTPGYYLWAITIPLIVNANTVTSTLNWTNTAYAIYAFSSNGATGTTGSNGLSALTAYQQLSQSASPPSTPGNTTGPTAPSGWSLTAPSVSVGNVLYYTFGQYNSSSATISGIPAGQTQWGTPTAASIFQDIRSDNWNGTTPPTYGVPSSYGTTGYYISRSTGNCYFNNGIFRGDISTSGQGRFDGQNNSSFTVPISGTNYTIYYSAFGTTPLTPGISGQVNAGLFGQASSLGSTWNVGVVGSAANNGIGVVGDGTIYGGFFSSTSGVGLVAKSTSASAALQVEGKMTITNSTLVSNLNANYLQSKQASDFATVASGTDAYAANRLNGSAGTNVLRFVQGTVTGASVATFNAAAKPGSASTNTWMQITIDGTTLYIPVWT
jgi:hypothetical protein